MSNIYIYIHIYISLAEPCTPRRIESVRDGTERRTTLMIRNIPNKYTQQMMLNIFNQVARGGYDFLYLPIDFKSGCNVGYAFINMTEPDHIVAVHDALHNKRWQHFNSEKVCQISFARIQGKSQLIAHFANSMLVHHEDPKCRPALFNSVTGEPEDFPMIGAPALGAG